MCKLQNVSKKFSKISQETKETFFLLMENFDASSLETFSKLIFRNFGNFAIQMFE